ncbi:putative P450 monooxygenase [Microthyrium microscopicum]|uniref:Benzoate 4-monooxygenase bphA n=1 Tax=Microthyrium microscopicum TaxID=703497 RepID=A0A6A6UT06_9PEZI|nr:putative P450 monooxygenase [Microthyrium microscopicum]
MSLRGRLKRSLFRLSTTALSQLTLRVHRLVTFHHGVCHKSLIYGEGENKYCDICIKPTEKRIFSAALTATTPFLPYHRCVVTAIMISYLISPYTLLLLPVLYYLLPYVRNRSLWDIPGPHLASFSSIWLLIQCRLGKRYQSVDEAHKKYGALVRLQPHHVSIADPEAIQIVYGHGNGFLKSEYYDAFVSIHRGLFNTRDRADHARKRRIVSHTFSAKNIGQFEQYMHANLELFFKRWTEMAETAKGGFAELDALHWLNYLAFDIIGDLAFGAPFGMLERGQDLTEVRFTPDAKPTYAPAIEVLNRRGEVSGTLGCLPSLVPYAKHFPDPFFSKGREAVAKLAGIAVARVSERLAGPETDRVDLLARLMQGRDANGDAMGRDELTAEALTQLIAGSDTTSNTSCAMLFHVLNNPHTIPKLQAELDKALPNSGVPTFREVKELPYLDNVIKETMRIHSTSSLGLPRLVVGEGLTVHGHYFPPGTVLSVPAYTIHHSKQIWGDDAGEFRPERWETVTEAQKNAFIPFSYGPRACVGRNVAEMELALIGATVFKNFEFELRQDTLETREGFLRKPLQLIVGMRRRTT